MSGGTWPSGSGGTWWRSPGWPTPHWVIDNAGALSTVDQNTRAKLGEMCMPSNVAPARLFNNGASNGTLGALNVVVGDSTGTGTQSAGVVITSPTPNAQLQWTDANGKVINSAVCGTAYNMTIPGLEGHSIYLVQSKNGSPQFSGTFPLPMSNYQSVCNQDEGTYTASAYSLVDGSLIASGSFTVLPQGSSAITGATGTTTPVPGATTSTGASVVNFLDQLSTTDWLLIGGLAVVILMGSGGRR